jgi:fimbrial chaperone protein
MRWQAVYRVLMAGLMVVSGSVGASGLQVAPIGLEFTPTSAAQGLWLTNTGDRELRAQVRVFHWTQADGKDELTSTQGLVASPPMLSLAPGGRQLVRVIRTGGPAAAGNGEDAFRILVDELPQQGQQQTSGLQYILRYSVPVFVDRVSAVEPDAVSAALHWSLERSGERVVLKVSNSGAHHAQIIDFQWLPATGDAIAASSGLLGYVLPGMTMRWPLTAPADKLATGTKFKAKINGKPVDQALSVGDQPR